MDSKHKHKLTLDQPAAYQITVPGALDVSMVDWITGMKLTVASDDQGSSVTTMVVRVDQAALQGLLRRIYSLGLPLISVICVEVE